MEGIPRTYAKSFGMKYIKCMLTLFNVLYLTIAVLMISGATTLKVILGGYYFEIWSDETVDALSILWIVIGCLLLALSIFGLVVATKESTMMTNFYGLLLSLIVILQMGAAVTGFGLITQTDGIVTSSLRSMMHSTQWNHENQNSMDWVQQTFHCCGNEGPSDWETIGRYTKPASPLFDEPEEFLDRETVARRKQFFENKMPQSCCISYSSYDEDSLRCMDHYTRGCHAPIRQIFAQSVMIWGSSALLIGMFQIFGVVSAFIFARSIRRNKTINEIHKWAVHESVGFHRPAYVDQ